MNSDATPSHHALERQTSHGYASSGSESRKPASSSGRKRASRAGTRSVTTLSAAQLERKRANDREAQRAIRQRTKEHIEYLEKSIGELRGSQESHDKLVAATQQRNRDLEGENAYLRSKLSQAGYSIDVPQAEAPRAPDSGLLSVHGATAATKNPVSGVQQSSQTPTPRSVSVTASQSSSSRHSSFQQHPGSYNISGPSGGPLGVPSGNGLSAAPGLTTWRSHDSVQSVQSTPVAVQDSQVSSANPYSQSAPAEWPTASSYPYGVSSDAGRHQQYESAATSHPSGGPSAQQYVQQPVSGYVAPSPASSTQSTQQQQSQQPTSYHAPAAPPQTEFQNMAVTSPAGYQVQQKTSYQQQAQQAQTYPAPQSYQMTPMHVPQTPSTEFVSPSNHMHPPPLPNSSYHAVPPSDAHYTAQQDHPAMPYGQDQGNRDYSLTHYPSG